MWCNFHYQFQNILRVINKAIPTQATNESIRKKTKYLQIIYRGGELNTNCSIGRTI